MGFVRIRLTLSCFSGVCRLFVNSLYTFLSTLPMRIWLFIKAFVTKIMKCVLNTWLRKFVYGLSLDVALVGRIFLWHRDTTLLKEIEGNHEPPF